MNASQNRERGIVKTNSASGDRSSVDRKTLFLDLSGRQGSIAEAISAAKWNVAHTTTLDQADSALYDSAFEVGVFTIQQSDLPAIEQLENLLNRHPLYWVAVVEPEVIEVERAAGLISDHCHDYHSLPCDTRQLISTLGHAYGMSILRPKPAVSAVMVDADSFMVGNSDVMKNLFATVGKSARVDAPVMITGQTGTGKELVGRALHDQSPRSNQPFVTLSCATVPASLIGVELFGSAENGPGRIEQANGGSLFLDSITDLPAEQQMILLRFMQSGCLHSETPESGTKALSSLDVRIITACSSSIDEAVKSGTFREDLYYRLNILHIEIPPLRARIGDVDSLAQYFFEKYIEESPGRIKGFSQQAKIAMHQHDWPGNVRELLNRVRQAIVMCESSLIQPVDLGLGSSTASEQDSDEPTNLDEVRAKAEGEFIRNALERNYNNVTETASQLGVSRVTLYRLMKKYGVNIAGSGRRSVSR